ncbi:MAG: acylneuraminate cytidylyltransferase [Clostridia bacterium]|nr:acylneuraminate cytidylyltransferase [Clostridia bacterium]
MSWGIVIQARMGSSRLPGKVLKKIGQRTLLEHILFRLQYLIHSAQIVVATSDRDKDDVIEQFCRQQGVLCFRGSETNVLERYYTCSTQQEFSRIIRLTGDNPFTDVAELDRLMVLHEQTRADYSHSFSQLPIGVGAEAFSYSALKQSYLLADLPHHLEHVNEYIFDHSAQFHIEELLVQPAKNRPDIRLTVDTLDDYKQACYIVKNCSGSHVTTEEAIQLCMQYV